MLKYKVEHIQEVSSTNTYLKDLTKTSYITEGTVILADFQTTGKGRGLNTWHSEKGKNLLFSILLKPEIEASHHFSLVEFVSLALIDTLNEYKIAARIKWPNDIFALDKKIAGILIENNIVADKIQTSIIGVGLNVNQVLFPEELPNAVSLKQVNKHEINKNELLRRILDSINIRYDQLLSNLFNELHEEYTNTIYRIGEKIYYNQKGEQREGLLKRISQTGEIFIESEHGKEFEYQFGEIQFL